MPENNLKLLLLHSEDQKNGTEGKWNFIEQFDHYINGMQIGEAFPERETLPADTLAKNITGYPSPWARCRFFSLAFSESKETGTVLSEIYRNLRSEWLGLLGLISTESSKIHVDKICLSESENNGPFVNLLRTFLPSNWADTDGENPFIQIIKYRYGAREEDSVIIGASSPDTLFFPAIQYKELSKHYDGKFYDNKKHRFVEPKLESLPKPQLRNFYLALSMIEERIQDKQKLKDTITTFISEYKGKVKSFTGLSDKIKGAFDCELPFEGMLKKIFENYPIYKKSGGYSFDGETGKEVNLENYLLKNDSEICELKFGDNSQKKSSDELKVWTLSPASDGNDRYFFPLPLTETGLREWCKDSEAMSGLLTPPDKNKPDNKPHLEAKLLKTKTGKILEVTLSLIMEQGSKQFVRNYKVANASVDSNCALWPNFISPSWNEYYLYSELPENCPIGSIITKPIYFDFQNNGNNPFLLEAEEIGSERKTLVIGQCDENFTVKDNEFSSRKIVDSRMRTDFSYDVWLSNKPIAGVSLSIKPKWAENESKNCGFLLFKNLKIINFRENPDSEVTLGVDFGSNNTCIYYKTKNATDSQPLEFKNLRIFAMGEDNGENRTINAKVDELVFFQNESVKGEFKSWVVRDEQSPLSVASGDKDKPVSGGMNVFEPNLDILSIDTNSGIMTLNGSFQLFYNMKWDNGLLDSFEESRKIFVSSFWLQARANLFLNQKIPSKVRFSYPKAFDQPKIASLTDLYQKIFGNKVALEDMTEANAILSSNSTDIIPKRGQAVVAMDIGGSTTDFLISYADDSDEGLLTIQSSIRMAAGCVVQLFEKSQKLRNTLVEYQQKNSHEFSILGIDRMEKDENLSYYYVNALFDTFAKNQDTAKQFYDSLARNPESRLKFALPAYIIGFLTFYVGILLRHILKENNGLAFDSVSIIPVGKGSHLLDWLQPRTVGNLTSSKTREDYLKKCLLAGLESPNSKLTLEFKYGDDERDPKSIVSHGLANFDDANAKTPPPSVVLFGERGILIKGKKIDEDTNLESGESNQVYPKKPLFNVANSNEPTPVFKSFIDLFFQYVKDWKLAENQQFIQTTIRFDKLQAYIGRRPDFRSDKYKESFLILEALYYLEEILIPALGD